MADAQRVSLLADDELALALHEIETAANAKCERADATTPAVADMPADHSPPAGPAVCDEPAPAPAAPPANDAVAGAASATDSEAVSAAPSGEAPAAATPVRVRGHNALLGESELNAALAELDSLPPEELAAIPDLDGPPPVAKDAAPAPPESKPVFTTDLPAEEQAAASPPATSQTAPPDASAAANANPRKLRFPINKKTPAAAAAAPAESPASAPASSAPPAIDEPKSAEGAEAPVESLEALAALAPAAPAAAAAGMTWSKRLYRASDWALEMVNRPTAWIPDAMRQTIGALALTTLAVSLLSVVLMPYLLPHWDAVDLLSAKVERLRHPPEVVEPAHGEAPAEGTSEGGAHGAAAAHAEPKGGGH